MALESLAELARIAPDTYIFRYNNHTAMFIATDEGVVLTDPIGQENPRAPYLIKEAVRSVTEQPVKYLLISHSAADHSTGGAAFADTATVVGHTKAAERMAARNDPLSPAPTVTFDKNWSVELGGKKIDLIASDMSPTDDYFILHYPAGGVLMAVDFVQPKNVPFRTLLGHPDLVVERLKWIHDNLDFDVLVSGHATPLMTGTKEDVLEQRQYYLDLSDAIEAAKASGAADNSEQMVAAVRSRLEPRYGSWRRFDQFLALNIEGVLGWRSGAITARV
jgi:glyoxylase-like metal-dependent hydrolase (beta-lactamase superfamily II)